MKKSITILLFMVMSVFALNITAHAQDAKPAEAVKVEAPKADVKAEAKIEAPKTEVKPVPESASMKPEDAAKDLATEDFMKTLVESVGGAKGLGSLGIVALILQMLALFFRTQLAMFAGKWRLLIIWSASLVGGTIALKVGQPEMAWTAALVHANTLGWAQGWFHQVWKQFIEKKNEVKA